jgi:hypothetical protein
LNLLAGYAYFFNPLRLLTALVRPKTRIPLADAEPMPTDAQNASRHRWKWARRRLRRKLKAYLGDAAVQLFGMWALTYTAPSMLRWSLRLMRGKIQRHSSVPTSQIPMRSSDGGPASHALPGTPISIGPPTRRLPPVRRKAA